jgi:hypothetical protein
MESDQDRAYGGRLADWEITTIDELAQEALEAATQREFIRHEQKFVDAYVRDLQRDCTADTQVRRSLVKARARLDAKAQGRTLTYWKEVHGTHSMDWVYDPAGTDRAPDGYDLNKARKEYDERQKRPRLRSVS